MSNIGQHLSGNRPCGDKLALLAVSTDIGICGSVSCVLGNAAGGYMRDGMWFSFAERAQGESREIARSRTC